MPPANIQSTGSVRRKVIFVFITCAVALVLAWVISRVAFTEMMDTVENITAPDPKLEMVSQISKDIMRLDQLQRAQAFIDNNRYRSFASESADIVASLDSLQSLYERNSTQLERIDSIKTLLTQRDKLFNAYVKVREKVVDNDAFSEQLQSLSEVIYEPTGDSTIVTTERKRRTTTISDDTNSMDTVVFAHTDDRGFFARLFGSRKQPDAEPLQQVIEERRMVEEELETVVDTIRAAPHDSTLARIDSAVQRFQMRQQQQRELFVNQEMELTIAGNTLISNMLSILQAVENEAMQQLVVDNRQARAVVNESVWRISAIFLGFFVITAFMVYLILLDIRRNNAYRIALEAAKEEAEYHAAAKQRFLANMSHELRTPLQSIIGYSEQLKQREAADPSQIDAIYQSSEHLLQIVNEILDYSRITSGKIVLTEKPFALSELVDNVVSVMKMQASDKQLDLALNTRILGSGYLLGDAFRIRQILFNLLSNAIKFTDRGKVTLNISTVVYEQKTELNIVVKDTGKGIPREDLERIFNDFEQAENANSGTYFGSGLGLSIVKTICEAMGGKIRVESKKGTGSVFKVNLPLKTSIKPETETVPATAPLSKSFAGTLWIVDDDQLILGLCQRILDRHNITYRCFTSPTEVLATPWDPHVKTILMDIRMPEMDGMQLNRELKKKIPGTDVNMFAFTAQALPEEQEAILAQGFDGILLKPFKEADLLNLLGIPTEATSQANGVSLTSIHQFVHGDEEQANRILRLYISDTLADLMTLQAHYENRESAEVELLAHRIAGRTAQVGADKIAFLLRKLEIDARSGELPPPAEFEHVVAELTAFIQQLQIHTHTESVIA